MEQEKTTPKEMLLRMIDRCRKVRKHKPKAVQEPKLKIGGLESVLFADSEIKHGKNWSRLETTGIRLAYRKHQN